MLPPVPTPIHSVLVSAPVTLETPHLHLCNLPRSLNAHAHPAHTSRCFRRQRPNTHNNKFHRPPIYPSPCPVRLSSYFFNIAVCMYVNQPLGWFGVNRLHHCGMAAIYPRLLCFRRIGNATSGMCVYVCASDSHAVTVLCFPLPPKNSPRKRRNVREVSA